MYVCSCACQYLCMSVTVHVSFPSHPFPPYSEQNELKDKDSVYDFFLDRPHVLSRVNRHVLAKSQVMDLSHPSKDLVINRENIERFLLVSLDSSSSLEDPVQVSARLASTMAYLSQPESKLAAMHSTLWCVLVYLLIRRVYY